MIAWHQQGIESDRFRRTSREIYHASCMVLKISCLLTGFQPSVHFPEHLLGVSDQIEVRELWRPFPDSFFVVHHSWKDLEMCFGLLSVWKIQLQSILFLEWVCMIFWRIPSYSLLHNSIDEMQRLDIILTEGLHMIMLPLPCLALSRWYLESNRLLTGCLRCCIPLDINMLNFYFPVHNA